jgi:PAS domain S-box-containing protein
MWSQGRARDPASASGTPARDLHKYLPGRTPLLRLISKWQGTRGVIPYVVALSGIAGVTLLVVPFVHTSVVPLIYLVLVLFVASAWGMSPAIVASLAGALAFDYFIIPPMNSFSFNTSEDWSTLLAFLITSVTAGKLSARARLRAVEAEAGQREIERLYSNLRHEYTERNRTQEALQQQAGELREQAQLLDLAHDAIMVRHLDGRITFWNQGAAERYGWSKQEAIGSITHQLLQTEFPQPMEEIMAELQGNSFWEGELEHSRRNGQRIVVASRWVLQRRDDSHAQAVMEINNDITERKRAEESLRKAHGELEQRVQERTRDLKTSNELLEMEIVERKRAQSILAQQSAELARSNSELEQFAYIASHDLQEPLRMVGSYVQLLERNYKSLFDAKGEEYIAYAVDGAKRMQLLINDLLSYSRVGTQGNEFALTDCAGVVGLTIKNLQKAIQESGATITCDPLPTVLADRMQLLQLFQNLLGNAIKFRAEQPPEIYITAKRTDGFWQFAVKDNGIGIEPRHFERIFLIFQRLHSRRHYPGTGMGLAICKKIVDRHGGTIWPVSEPGMGTTFFFTLPDHGGDHHESQ